MSDVTGTARGWGPPADTAARRNVWLIGLIALTALLAFGNLANDAVLDFNYGWDTRVNCAAVDAHAKGLDPYFVRNLQGTKLSYPYLPVTLDVFRPICADGVLLGHHRSIFVVLAVLCGLLLPGLGRGRPRARDVALRMLCVFGAFVGFEWVQASGNFAILSGVLTAIALTLLLRPPVVETRHAAIVTLRLVGAALLGLVMSFKLVFFPVLAALYFLPLSRGRKLAVIAAAVFGFALPILASRLFYPDLFASWLLAIGGGIPGQHSVDLLELNPSLLLLAHELVVYPGLGAGKPALFAAYGLLAAALVLVPFALTVLHAIGSGSVQPLRSLPTRLDRWLMDHPRTARRITVLAMFALYLSAPRLKEYAFFELAIYAAVLIVDLSAIALAAVLAVGVAIPALLSLWGVPFEGSFILLVVAMACFWILLLDFRKEPQRLEIDERV